MSPSLSAELGGIALTAYLAFKTMFGCSVGCRHSSVDLFVSIILWSWVRIPSIPSALYSFTVKCAIPICHCIEKRTKINKKRPLRVPPKLSATLGSNPKHTIYTFIIFNLICVMLKIRKYTEKEAGVGPFSKKKHIWLFNPQRKKYFFVKRINE